MQKKEKSLYVPELEHDACGIGFLANLKGKKSHDIIDGAITMLENMEHRGATGFEANTGDGAGVLIQNPHDFFVRVCKKLGFELPEFGKYGVGMIFFPSSYDKREKCREALNSYFVKFGFKLLGYRRVPTNNQDLGATARSVEPIIEQVFIEPEYDNKSEEDLERRLFVLRKYSNPKIRTDIIDEENFHIVSLSYKTIIYKGQLRAIQIRDYFSDLEDKSVVSALALIHSRFSTNTFPKWKLAQPFRFLAHNGEINTIRGNLNWTKSFETLFRSSLFTKEEIELITPLLDETQSDSSNLDKMVEMLLLGGRSLPHVMMMLIPEAWEHDAEMEQYKKDFYKFHASLMQPWDGPASISFTDGKSVGACLDRNGLRPSRYCLLEDDTLIMASEAGALPIDESKVVLKGRLEPGKIFIADLEKGAIISDQELKADICKKQPYNTWLAENSFHINQINTPKRPINFDNSTLRVKQHAFGYTSEDLKVILAPMFTTGKEPLGSMGADVPLAVLSDQSHHISHYFKQLFAQVSNPPMDPIRERPIMSLFSSIGKTRDILAETPRHCQLLEFEQPVLTNEELEKIRNITHLFFKCKEIHAVFNADGKPGRLEEAIDRISEEAEDAIRYGCYNILLITHRNADKDNAPIPSLLATGGVHHRLINDGLRVRVGLVVEAGDVFETHHYATLVGYGANAINPYLAFETLKTLRDEKLIPDSLSNADAAKNYIKAVGLGLLKTFSKMGISTLRSYHGAQIFEILGLNNKVVNKCFTRSISRIEGIGFDGIAREVLAKQKSAYHIKGSAKANLETGGLYQWKRRGEFHLFNPQSIHYLQQATRTNDYELYKKYSQLINNQEEKVCTIRGLFKFKKRRSIMIEEVEPVEKILKRFSTGAMSFGSISYEAHSTIAIAMNRIGGRSNSGEGGEDPVRFERKENGDLECSAIKQVASGRFGVTSYYLTNAKEIQIKMAQGAKPGEGGQLPGYKVNDWIGRVRHSTPGVGLISPPPHHDIYSIEDLSQLIYDLKRANRKANINVKLVSEAGVGTIAAGVAKARADLILISGGDGGTGASPVSSIYHTGLPWELGISEAHQTLVKNNLRSRVVLQADGQMKTGRDLAIATLLGAEEWGVATAALIVEGCVMMRKCHVNTCPVGIATQNEELRKLFTGDPDHLVNLFTFFAQELREIMAELGFRSINEMVGQANVLKVKDNIDKWKIKDLDLSPILYQQPADKNVGLYKQIEQDHLLEDHIDWQLIEKALPALQNKEKVTGNFAVKNTDRTIGAMLSNEISKLYKGEGLPEGTINYSFRGSAGQSFGAFSAKGLLFELEGEANDYLGKGLSGAELVVRPDKISKLEPRDNVIIGNVAFYGATSGEAYIHGLAGQRFCVRNSGVKVVVEGIGDHGCEYMTGGVALILGATGRNFAAGMSGGIAYVYDINKKFDRLCNMESVAFDPIEEDDVEMIQYLLKKHIAYTGSKFAEKVMNNWDEEIKSFIKVMPVDYKAVLLKRKAEENKKSEEVTA